MPSQKNQLARRKAAAKSEKQPQLPKSSDASCTFQKKKVAVAAIKSAPKLTPAFSQVSIVDSFCSNLIESHSITCFLSGLPSQSSS